MNLFGPIESPMVRSILDGLREDAWTTTVFSPRRTRDEEVRALAMEFDERQSLAAAADTDHPSFGPDVRTEADISPGS